MTAGRSVVIGSVFCCFGGVLMAGEASTAPSALGMKMDRFALNDAYGKEHRLADYQDSKLVVLAFLGTECPLARLYAPRLSALAAKYQLAGVTFLGVSSNVHDNVTELKNFARVHELEFPILKDLGNVLADQVHAERVPYVLVLDRERVVRYRGRIDDQYGLQPSPSGKRVSYQLREPRRQDLAIALDELLAGKPVGTPETEATGCLIGRKKDAETGSEVTYSDQIVRLLNKHCVECHRPNQIGPFTLTNYEDAAGWAEMINEVVQEQRMPPWHADPRYGHFVNDARLTEEEKQLVARWVEAGAPEGNPAGLPEPPQFTDGWMIPEPDEIIYMPEPFTVQAEGTVDYQMFVVDPGWKEDKWVAAMEPRPGTPAVVHHIVMYVVPPSGVSKYFSAKLPKTQLDWFASFAPGLRPPLLPQGTARYIPAGSKLMFQMHYTPNGTEQTDRSYVGIKYADPKTVKREVAVQHAGNHNFRIPPRAENHEVESWYEFEHDSLLWSVSPHMHWRGKDFIYTLIYPSGDKEVVLNVPQYDFGWQTTYTFVEPKRVPKGSKLHCIAHFDNSENNLNNPDPTVAVRYGPQTWEEMMYGWFEICLADQDVSAELARGPRDPRQRTKEFAASIASGTVAVDAALRNAAEAAAESDAQFAKFAELLSQSVPQIDRLDITYVEGDRLKLLRIAELNGVRTTFRSAATTLEANGCALAKYIVDGGEPVVHADTGTIDDPLISRMARRGIKSSVHFPFEHNGQKHLLSLWSGDPDGFPHEVVQWLTGLVRRGSK